MANAIDYLAWRGDLRFETDGVNEVDLFLLGQISTPDYSGIADDGRKVSIHAAAEAYFAGHTEDVSNLGVLQSGSVLPMLRKMAQTERYRDVMLFNYENIVKPENNEQFSAVTILLTEGTMVISFRGTDDTIVGWREDFNIAIEHSVPAQKDAADYLNRVGAGFCGDIVLVGHSKGGNLAVYAAANADQPVRDRLRAVYSFDGPGFREEFLQSAGYRSIAPLVKTVLSQHSIVAVLMKMAGERQIVKSNVAGPMGHDGFNWEVLGTHFIRMEELNPASRAYGQAADSLLFGMEQAELKAFINELFGILEGSGAATIAELSRRKPAEKRELMKALSQGRRVNSFAGEFIEKMVKAFFQIEIQRR